MKRLGLLFVSILLVWIAYVGVWFDELIPGYDATAYVIDTNLLKNVNFNFKDYLYRYEILGGTQIYDIYGVPSFLHIYKFLRLLDLHPVTMFNGYIFYYQLLLGYFGMKSVELTREYFYRTERKEKVLSVLVGLIFSFLPLLGLRITHGHVNPELITIPMFFVIVLGFQFDRFSLLDLLLVNFVLYTVSPPNGQLAVYTAFFPVFVYLGLSIEIFRNGDKRKLFQALSFLIISTISAFLIFLPELTDRLAYLKSSDTLRNLTATRDLVYSYTTHTWEDFVSSLSFMLEPFPTRPDAFLLHETNYPMGFLPLLIFFLPLRKHRTLFFSLLITVIIIFGLSMDISPIQELVLKLNPVLLGFRVPARSISIFIILVFILSLSLLLNQVSDESILERFRKEKHVVQFLSALVLMTLLLTSPVIREILFLTILCAFIYSQVASQERIRSLNYLMLPVVMCTFLSAFRERYQPSSVNIKTYSSLQDLGEGLKSTYPELKTPLTRISAVGDFGVFGNNLPLLMGISSIEGYRLMHKRFIHVLNSMRGRPTLATELWMEYRPAEPNFDLVSRMYNIKGVLIGNLAENKLQLQMLERESKPVWFVQEIRETENFSDLIENKDRFYDLGYVIEPVTPSIAGNYDRCRDSKVELVESKFNSQKLRLKINSSEDCPLIVSTNFTEKIQAFDSLTGEKLLKFPAWGSLLGVLVKKGSKEIEINALPTYPRWIELVSIFGWILMAINMIFAARKLFVPLLPGNRRNGT